MKFGRTKAPVSSSDNLLEKLERKYYELSVSIRVSIFVFVLCLPNRDTVEEFGSVGMRSSAVVVTVKVWLFV